MKLQWFKKLGTVHHTRWMGTMLCILKMILVGDDLYDMGATQQHGVTDLAFFIVYIYSDYWFAIPVSADVPFLILTFWKDLSDGQFQIQPSHLFALKNLIHTWYLSPQNIPLALFSDLVKEDMNSNIARALLENPCSPV